MARVKGPMPPPKKVWRLSEAVPAGEWVDPNEDDAAAAAAPALGALPEVSSGGWVMSSFDLLNGVDVSDEEVTVPGDLLDELFPPRAATPKADGRS